MAFSERNRVTYSKKMRERAKLDGKMLFTIDLETASFRTTSQGPISQEKALIVRKAMLMLNGFTESEADKHLEEFPTAE